MSICYILTLDAQIPQITKEQVAERIEWYRSRTWHLDDPRCESRGAYKLHGSTFAQPHCVLPAGHQGDHLGPDDATWPSTETPRVSERLDSG